MPRHSRSLSSVAMPGDPLPPTIPTTISAVVPVAATADATDATTTQTNDNHSSQLLPPVVIKPYKNEWEFTQAEHSVYYLNSDFANDTTAAAAAGAKRRREQGKHWERLDEFDFFSNDEMNPYSITFFGDNHHDIMMAQRSPYAPVPSDTGGYSQERRQTEGGPAATATTASAAGVNHSQIQYKHHPLSEALEALLVRLSFQFTPRRTMLFVFVGLWTVFMWGMLYAKVVKEDTSVMSMFHYYTNITFLVQAIFFTAFLLSYCEPPTKRRMEAFILVVFFPMVFSQVLLVSLLVIGVLFDAPSLLVGEMKSNGGEYDDGTVLVGDRIYHVLPTFVIFIFMFTVWRDFRDSIAHVMGTIPVVIVDPQYPLTVVTNKQLRELFLSLNAATSKETAAAAAIIAKLRQQELQKQHQQQHRENGSGSSSSIKKTAAVAAATGKKGKRVRFEGYDDDEDMSSSSGPGAGATNTAISDLFAVITPNDYLAFLVQYYQTQEEQFKSGSSSSTTSKHRQQQQQHQRPSQQKSTTATLSPLSIPMSSLISVEDHFPVEVSNTRQLSYTLAQWLFSAFPFLLYMSIVNVQEQYNVSNELSGWILVFGVFTITLFTVFIPLYFMFNYSIAKMKIGRPLVLYIVSNYMIHTSSVNYYQQSAPPRRSPAPAAATTATLRDDEENVVDPESTQGRTEAAEVAAAKSWFLSNFLGTGKRNKNSSSSSSSRGGGRSKGRGRREEEGDEDSPVVVVINSNSSSNSSSSSNLVNIAPPVVYTTENRWWWLHISGGGSAKQRERGPSEEETEEDEEEIIIPIRYYEVPVLRQQ